MCLCLVCVPICVCICGEARSQQWVFSLISLPIFLRQILSLKMAFADSAKLAAQQITSPIAELVLACPALM